MNVKWFLQPFALAPFLLWLMFFLLRLEKKPWTKAGPGAQAKTKQQGSTRIRVAWRKAMAMKAWKKAMTKEACKKATRSHRGRRDSGRAIL